MRRRWLAAGLLAAAAPACMAESSPASVVAPLAGAAQAARLIADLSPGGPVPGAELVDLAVAGGRPYFLTNEYPDGIALHTVDPQSGQRSIWHGQCCAGEIWGSLGTRAVWASPFQPSGQDALWRTNAAGSSAEVVTYQGLAVAPVRDEGSGEGRHAFLGQSLYFQAHRVGGPDLYRVGATGEAQLVLEAASSPANWLTSTTDRIFFVSVDGSPALFAAQEGGAPVKLKTFAGWPRLLTAAGSKIFFVAGTADDEELWVSDGTAAGTKAMTSFAAPRPFDQTRWLRAIAERLYFIADDIVHGQELWRSDGTAAGTIRLTDFGYATAFPEFLEADAIEETAGRVLFFASDGLTPLKIWVNDGTTSSTFELLQPCAGGCAGGISPKLLRVGGRVVFSASTPAQGLEPWATDGTKQGTGPLSDLCPGACSSQPEFGPMLGGRLYFEAQRANDRGVWQTNGTTAGTKRIAQFPIAAFIGAMAPVPSGVFFWAARSDVGGQLWWTAGTLESVRPLTALAGRGSGSKPQGIEPLGQRVVFKACQGLEPGLWSVTPPGPGAPVKLVSLPGSCDSFGTVVDAVVDGKAFFPLAEFGAPSQMWRSDGTAVGTFLVASVLPPSWLASKALELGSRVVFFVGDETQYQLWSSDGSIAGTHAEFTLPGSPYFIGAYPSSAGEFYFVTSDGGSATTIWRSDGTLAGTRVIRSGWRLLTAPEFLRVGAFSYFFAQQDLTASAELFRTDGTAAGTISLRDFGNISFPNEPFGLVARGNEVFFIAPTDGTWGLWRSDGSGAGTHQVQALSPTSHDPSDPRPGELTVVGPSLFFASADDEHGQELWRSDGTAAGTTMLKNIAPADLGSHPRSLVAANGRLYFTADDVLHGAELWTSDGAPAGTQLVQDLSPGPRGSVPGETTQAGDDLLFAADDGLAGRELWALSLPPGPQPACAASTRNLCLGGGRFQVSAAWRDFEGRTGEGTAVGLTGDTGYFWFFDAANVEVVVKVLDGRGVNGHRWVFYGALSSVEYSLTVTDTETGASRRYVNPRGVLASVADTSAFGPNGALPASVSAPAPAQQIVTTVDGESSAAPAGVCVESSTRLCLNGDRFALEAVWKDFQGNTGVGTAVSLSADTGYFWFFDAANIELVTKVLDGRSLNDKFWLFYGALSSVEYTLTVTDTQTGVKKTYRNALGKLGSVADTRAF